jgi:hypothetical protein
MCVQLETFSTATAFLNGYDQALSGRMLDGFREWLILQIGQESNLTWSGLVLELLGDSDAQGDPEKLIDELFALLDRFITVRDAHDGLRRIFVQYEGWLRRQDWYTPDSSHWIAFESSPTSPPRAPKVKRQRKRRAVSSKRS